MGAEHAWAPVATPSQMSPERLSEALGGLKHSVISASASEYDVSPAPGPARWGSPELSWEPAERHLPCWRAAPQPGTAPCTAQSPCGGRRADLALCLLPLAPRVPLF